MSAVEYALLVVAILLVVAGGYRVLGAQNAKSVSVATATLYGHTSSNPSGGGGSIPTGGGGHGSPGGGNVVCEGASCRGPGACFVAGTLVATPSGEHPIESLREGDLVFARGESPDDAVRARPVVRTLVRPAPSLVDVHIVHIDGEHERVRSTPDHPYRTLDRGWSVAGDLVGGDTLIERSGNEARVTKVVPIAQEASVYNLVVDVDHTYFVGHTGVLVHNGQCDGPGGSGAGGNEANGGDPAAIRQSYAKALEDLRNETQARLNQLDEKLKSAQGIREYERIREEGLKEIATWAHGERREVGERHKDATPPEIRELIYQRNEERYGDKLGPSVDYLRRQGKSWESIVDSASRPNQEINASLGVNTPPIPLKIPPPRSPARL
ncbi:polymorphic toxin-type HINT domain-containing protein [Pendulispora albinea]|uniref:HINT domain-containing protein n=1 Tax=Pendulispora albinea TaxID=2741071 RepID=A0ABZ2M836_9BACT